MLQRRQLRKYQNRAVGFVKERKHCALFLDMGLGKTVSLLTAIADLLREREVKRVLLVAPVRVMYGVWRQEARKWAHTRHLTFKMLHGNEYYRLRAMNSNAEIHIINPEQLAWLIKVLSAYSKRRSYEFPYDMLAIDESSMFKNYKALRFKKLKPLLRKFDRRVIMTGTPSPNGLMDLWSQMYIVDEGQRLGTAIDRYRRRFFTQADYNGYKFDANEGAEQTINKLIGPVVLCMQAEDYIDMPKIVTNVIYVDLPPDARAKYDRFEQEFFLEFDKGHVVDAESAATLSMKCQQMANGMVYVNEEDDDGSIVAKHVVHIHDAKLKALQEIRDGTGDQLLIGFAFKHDLIGLRKMFPNAKTMGGGSKSNARETGSIISAWQRREVGELIVHPASAAHGLDGLQHACHTICNFGLTYSLEWHLQLMRRIQRPGQPNPFVVAHYIVARNTVDEAIMAAIERKGKGQQAVIDALKEYRAVRTMSTMSIEDLMS